MNKSIKDVIDSRLLFMKVDPEIKENLLKRTSGTTEIKTQKRFKKPLIAAAAVILCLLLSVPILGATSEAFNNLLFDISPQLAEILMPLDKECISNGIKMEVLAAVADEENSIVYLTLHDEEGERLQNSGYLDDIKPYWRTTSSTHDKESGTLYTRLSTTGSFASNEPQTLTSKGLDVNGETVAVDIDLTQLQESTGILYEYKGISSYGVCNDRADDSFMDEIMEAGNTTILEPDVYKTELPTRLQISNIGFIDGKLHVQTVERDYDREYKEYSTLLLTNEQGDGYSWYDISYLDGDFTGFDYFIDLESFSDDNTKYTEYVMDMTPEDLVGYKLNIMENNYIKGEWTATFRVDVYESRRINCDVAVRDAKVTDLIISPIRMRIEYLGWARDGEPFDVTLKMKDGETVKYLIDLMKDDWRRLDTSEGYELMDGSVGWNVSYTGYTIEILPSVPFDVDNISEITVNNVVVS